MAKEDNLIKFNSETGRLAGMKSSKKGSKHLSTIIRELSENVDWNKTNLKNKSELQEKYGKNGWLAVVYVAFTKAITGDTKAMEWLSKNGYGSNIDITSGGEKLNVALVEFVGDDPDENED